jgi:hypothetical protein
LGGGGAQGEVMRWEFTLPWPLPSREGNLPLAAPSVERAVAEGACVPWDGADGLLLVSTVELRILPRLMKR